MHTRINIQYQQDKEKKMAKALISLEGKIPVLQVEGWGKFVTPEEFLSKRSRFVSDRENLLHDHLVEKWIDWAILTYY